MITTANSSALFAFSALILVIRPTDAFLRAPTAAWSNVNSLRKAARVPRSAVLAAPRGGYRTSPLFGHMGGAERKRVLMMSSEAEDFLDEDIDIPSAAAAAAAAASSSAAAAAQPPALAVDPKKPPKNMLEAYSRALEGFPLLTKTLTSGMLSVLGYCLSQLLIRQPICNKQLMVYGLTGTFYVPVVLHLWFGFLEWIVTSTPVSRFASENKIASALVQLSLDQTVGAALVNGGFFAIYIWIFHASQGQFLLPGGLKSRLATKLSMEFWPMMRANWRLWPVANFMNFALVPVRFRVLVTNVVALFWHVIITQMAIRA